MSAAIASELAAGEVAIAGLGKFSVSGRSAREDHNPATGEPIHIAAGCTGSSGQDP